MKPLILLSLAGLFWVTLGPSVEANPKATGAESNLRDGFFLLQDVSQREAWVGLITFVKTSPPELADYAKKISVAADQTLAVVDRAEKADSSVQGDSNPLPAIERDARQSIREDKQDQLLFGTKGPAFARAFLLAQIEAATYITHLAKVMAAEDPNAARARALQKISDRWLQLRNEGFRLLNAS